MTLEKLLQEYNQVSQQLCQIMIDKEEVTSEYEALLDKWLELWREIVELRKQNNEHL